jgi:hypothetical protein
VARRPILPGVAMDRTSASSPGENSPYERKGDNLVVRRIATLIVSCTLVLGLGVLQIRPAFAQDQAKKDAPPAKPDASKEAKEPAAKPATEKPAEPAKDKEKPAEPAKDKEKKEEAPKATEAPLPPIPKEVQDKIDAARRAVAEAIVAAQDAGLVETSIDPPPILDILITGRAIDARAFKNPSAKKPYAVSPEVFAAWFTGYFTQGFDTVDYVKDVRITKPSDGLKALFDQRAAILRNEIAEVRKAKGTPAATKPAEKKEAEKPADAKKDGEPTKK